MRRLGRGQDAFGPGEAHRFREALVLLVRTRLDEPVLHEQAQRRCVAVIAETARVDGVRDEVVAEREHRHHRSHAGGVTEVVGEEPASQRRARRRFRGDETGLRLAGDAVGEERVRETGEVGPPTHTADDDIGVRVGHLHLLLGLLPDDRLVEEDMVDHRPERIVAVVMGGRILDRFGDGHAEASR
jgi:hypothetical protein